MHVIKCTGDKHHCKCLIEEGINHCINEGMGLAHLPILALKLSLVWPSAVCFSLVPEISPTGVTGTQTPRWCPKAIVMSSTPLPDVCSGLSRWWVSADCNGRSPHWHFGHSSSCTWKMDCGCAHGCVHMH